MCKSLLSSLLAVGLFHAVAFTQFANDSVRDRALADNFYCQAFGPGLPFAGSNARRDRLPDGMIFTTFLLDQPPVDGDVAPPQDPLVPDQPPDMQPAEPGNGKRAFPATTPSIIADRSVGVGLLVAGVAGWGLLTIAFLILVGRQPKS
jgi:hypothetical protein